MKKLILPELVLLFPATTFQSVNPATKIRFDIQNAGKIKLLVHDILEKEISVLINEKLSAGSYEYTFDAGALPSGIYFYSLITDKAGLTKKMLLTK